MDRSADRGGAAGADADDLSLVVRQVEDLVEERLVQERVVGQAARALGCTRWTNW